MAFFVQESTFTQSNSVRDFLVLFLGFVRQKGTITENITCRLSVRNLASRLLQIGQKSENDNDVTIFRHDVKVNFFDVVLFLLSSLVSGPSSMSISSQVLEL